MRRESDRATYIAMAPATTTSKPTASQTGQWPRMEGDTAAVATRAAASKQVKRRARFQKRLIRTSAAFGALNFSGHFEQISRAAHGFQVCGLFGIGFDFLTQAANVHVHASRGDEAVRAPHAIE